MENLNDIIQFENENIFLDFKAVQYKKNSFESLLKDIMSMANANIQEDRFIIIGVGYKAGGKRDIIGINEDFVDDAVYQQLIRENIEPDIEFKYFPFEFQGKKLGVFQITNCSNPPYMLKKDYSRLSRGDTYIRKGSHQTRLTRKDLDLYVEQKKSETSFKGKVLLFFNETKSKTIEITCNKDFELPSEKAAKKIKTILQERDKLSNLGLGQIPYIHDFSPFGNNSYIKRSTETLIENLKTVNETYQEEDYYHLFEIMSHKINIMILNQGNKYIEDASIEVRIHKNSKFVIADKIYSKPQFIGLVGISNPMPYVPILENINYPNVTETEDEYIIFENVGNIKHNISQKVFGTAIRIVFARNCIEDIIVMNCKIFGKNLIFPITDKLELKVKE